MSVLKIKSNNLDLELQLDGNGMVNAIQEGAVLTTSHLKWVKKRKVTLQVL